MTRAARAGFGLTLACAVMSSMLAAVAGPTGAAPAQQPSSACVPPYTVSWSAAAGAVFTEPQPLTGSVNCLLALGAQANVAFEPTGRNAAQCVTETRGPVPLEGNGRFAFNDATPACNTTYDVVLTVDDFEASTISYSWSIKAPPVVSLNATAPGDGTVALSWQPPVGFDPASAPPDFLGYRIERRASGGQFAAVTGVGPGSTSYTDAALPAGDYDYRVLTIREGADGARLVPITDTATATVSISAPATTSTTASTATTAPGAPPTTSRPRTTVPSGPVVNPPRTSGGRGAARGGPLEPDDPGFEETLSYDEFEPGLDDAILPEDASAFLDVEDDAGANRGVLVPFAVASCLVGWAMHLRYLSRRAAEPG